MLSKAGVGSSRSLTQPRRRGTALEASPHTNHELDMNFIAALGRPFAAMLHHLVSRRCLQHLCSGQAAACASAATGRVSTAPHAWPSLAPENRYLITHNRCQHRPWHRMRQQVHQQGAATATLLLAAVAAVSRAAGRPGPDNAAPLHTHTHMCASHHAGVGRLTRGQHTTS